MKLDRGEKITPTRVPTRKARNIQWRWAVKGWDLFTGSRGAEDEPEARWSICAAVLTHRLSIPVLFVLLAKCARTHPPTLPTLGQFTGGKASQHALQSRNDSWKENTHRPNVLENFCLNSVNQFSNCCLFCNGGLCECVCVLIPLGFLQRITFTVYILHWSFLLLSQTSSDSQMLHFLCHVAQSHTHCLLRAPWRFKVDTHTLALVAWCEKCVLAQQWKGIAFIWGIKFHQCLKILLIHHLASLKLKKKFPWWT